MSWPGFPSQTAPGGGGPPPVPEDAAESKTAGFWCNLCKDKGCQECDQTSNETSEQDWNNFQPVDDADASFSLSADANSVLQEQNEGASIPIYGDDCGDCDDPADCHETAQSSSIHEARRGAQRAVSAIALRNDYHGVGDLRMEHFAVPKDHHCLFAAILELSLNLPGQSNLNDRANLRKLCAEKVLEGAKLPDSTYTKAFLEDKEPGEYANWIQQPGSWGGGVEIEILAEHFNVEVVVVHPIIPIISYNVPANDEQRQRIYLMYTGEHYDLLRGFEGDSTDPISLFPANRRTADWEAAAVAAVIQATEQSEGALDIPVLTSPLLEPSSSSSTSSSSSSSSSSLSLASRPTDCDDCHDCEDHADCDGDADCDDCDCYDILPANASKSPALQAEIKASQQWRQHSSYAHDTSRMISLIVRVESQQPFSKRQSTATADEKELQGYFGEWEQICNTPYPNRKQLLHLATKDQLGRKLAVRIALCPKGLFRSLDISEANQSFLVEYELRANMAFSEATEKPVGEIFFFDFKPYCHFYTKSQRPSKAQRDREITPGDIMYLWNALYVRFTLAILRLVREVVFITCIGSDVQTAMYGKTFLQHLGELERQNDVLVGRYKAQDQGNKTQEEGEDPPQPAMSPPLARVPGSLVTHAAALAHKASSRRFITVTKLRELVANVDLHRMFAVTQEQRALGVVEEAADVLIGRVYGALSNLKREHLVPPPPEAEVASPALPSTVRQAMWDHPMSFEQAVAVKWRHREAVTLLSPSPPKSVFAAARRKPRKSKLKTLEECQENLAKYASTIAQLGAPLPARQFQHRSAPGAPRYEPLPRSTQRNRMDVQRNHLVTDPTKHSACESNKRALAVHLDPEDLKLCGASAAWMQQGVRKLRSMGYSLNKLTTRADAEGTKLLVGDEWLRLERLRSHVDRVSEGMQAEIAVLTFRRADGRSAPTTADARVFGLCHVVCLLLCSAPFPRDTSSTDDSVRVSSVKLLYERSKGAFLDCRGQIPNAAKHTFELLEDGAVFVTIQRKGWGRRVGVVVSSDGQKARREEGQKGRKEEAKTERRHKNGRKGKGKNSTRAEVKKATRGDLLSDLQAQTAALPTRLDARNLDIRTAAKNARLSFQVHFSQRKTPMVLGLHLLLTLYKDSNHPGFQSLQWWSQSAKHQCQTRRTTTEDDAANGTPLRLFLFTTAIRVEQEQATDDTERPARWVLILSGARPCCPGERLDEKSAELRLSLPQTVERPAIEAYICASLLKKRSNDPKVIELFWLKDRQQVSSVADIGAHGVECVIRPVPDNWQPQERKDRAATRRRRKHAFAMLTTKQKIEVHAWSRVPYRWRPSYVSINPHMAKHHAISPVTLANFWANLADDSCSDAGGETVHASPRVVHIDPLSRLPSPDDDNQALSLLERKVYRQLQHHMAVACYGTADSIIGGIRSPIHASDSDMELMLNAMRRLTLLDDIACLCFLTVRRLLGVVGPIACALAAAGGTDAEEVGLQQYKHTESVLARIVEKHGSAGTVPDVEGALDERFRQTVRSRDDWLSDSSVLVDVLCTQGDCDASAEAALRFVSQGLKGPHTDDLVFACLLVALRCGDLTADGKDIEWKQGDEVWTNCISSLTMEEFKRFDEKALSKSLLSALPVELPSGQTVVLLPAVNVKNDGTLSKPNTFDLWPLLDAFVSSIATLAAQEGEVPPQITTVLTQSTCSSFLAQAGEQPGHGDAVDGREGGDRNIKRRRQGQSSKTGSNPQDPSPSLPPPLPPPPAPPPPPPPPQTLIRRSKRAPRRCEGVDTASEDEGEAAADIKEDDGYWCKCGEPDSVENMVGCEGDGGECWWHESCAIEDNDGKSLPELWYCSNHLETHGDLSGEDWCDSDHAGQVESRKRRRPASRSAKQEKVKKKSKSTRVQGQTESKQKKRKSSTKAEGGKDKKATVSKEGIQKRFHEVANQMTRNRSQESPSSHRSPTFSVTVGANENLPARSSEVLAEMCQLALNPHENDSKTSAFRGSVQVGIRLDSDSERHKTVVIGDGPGFEVEASSHELLCLRAVSAMCGLAEDGHDGKVVVKGQFTSDTVAPKKRAQVALDMSELLQTHRIDWYLHPAKVRGALEKKQKQLDQKATPGTPSPTAVDSNVDKILEAAQTVFVPVDMQVRIAHLGEGVRVARATTTRTQKRTAQLAKKSPEQQAKLQSKWAEEDADRGKLKDCLRSASNLWGALKPIFRILCVNRSSFHTMSPHPEQFLDRVVTNRTTFADILTRDLNDPVQYIRKALSVVAPTAGEQKTTQTASVGEHEKKITSEQLAEVKKQLRTHKIPTNMRKGDYFRAVLAEERILDQAATHLPRFEALWAMGEPKLKEQAKRCKTYRATQLAILQERLRLHQQAKEACLVRDPRQLLNADDVGLWLTKREASMKADETRRAKGKKSSAINPKRFEVGGSGETPLLLLPDVSAQRFKSRSIKSSRFPLKLHKKKITLVTCDGDQVVVSSASNAKAKKVPLERLAHLRPHVQFQLVEYHFQAIGERKRFELTKKKRGGPYLGLRPADTDSPLGHDVRAGVRTAYDIMAGEVTYGPTTKLTQHIPVKATKTTTRLSNGAEVEEENEHGGDEGDDATGQDKGEDAGGVDVDVQEQKDGGDEDSDEKEKGFGGDGDNDGNQDDVDETKDGHTHALMQEYRDLFDKVCAKVASESDMAGSTALKNWKRKNRNSMIGRIEKQLRTRRRRAVREREMEQAFATAGTDPNSVSGLACGCQDHHGDNGCQKVSNPTHSSASVCDLHRHGSNSTRWRTGLEHIPEALRKWDPGLDPFGVPYLSITRHSDQDRRRLWARFELRGGALSSRWQFGADPNIMSFYDLYLPATGCVIHVGQGWAQRVYNRYGVANDDCASKMDHLINEQLRKADWVTDAELKLAKLAITRRLETGTDRDARVYQECTRQIDENWAAIAKAQDRLHEVTCILMAAFEIRILPWMETDQMLQAKGGVFQLSKANKRKLSFLSHGKFRQRLIHHCGDPNHSSNRIVWVTEEYTSKLCGRCGCYCGYLRGSRTFKCPNEQCGQHVDRDGNAAKNIWTWGLLEALRRMDAEQTHAAASSASSNATSLPCNPPHGGLGATMASL